jgi:hypothetical protein
VETHFYPIALAYRQHLWDDLSLPFLLCDDLKPAGINVAEVLRLSPRRDKPTPLALLSGDPVYVLMSLLR